MRQRAELLAHVHHTHSPYNLPASGKQIASKAHRDGVAERFADEVSLDTLGMSPDHAYARSY
jgi:hypothetical protein